MPPLYWLLTFSGILLGATGGILLKKGATEIAYGGGVVHVATQMLLNWKIILAVALYFVPFVIWLVVLKKVDISFLQPIFSLVYVVTPLLAMVILREQVPAARWLGIAVIIVGVALVARS